MDPLRSTTLRGIRSARSGLGQRSFRSFLCPTPKVTPRSSLGDVGEARWPLSHRWADTSSTLPDAAHDSRNQRRVVSLSALSLLSACVRLRQLREVHHNLQQSLTPSPLTDAERSNRRFTCTSLMLRLCVMLKVPSQSSVRSLLVLLLCKQRCSSCSGHYRPLQRRSTSGKCSVRCRPIKLRKFTATFDQILPSIKYIFAFFFQKFTANVTFGTIWRIKFLQTYCVKPSNVSSVLVSPVSRRRGEWETM